jgi:hypothetical protein
MTESWSETYAESPEAERLEFERLAREIMRVQLKTAKAASAHIAHPVDRAFHAKATLAVGEAELRFLDRPARYRARPARRRAAHPRVAGGVA